MDEDAGAAGALAVLDAEDAGAADFAADDAEAEADGFATEEDELLKILAFAAATGFCVRDDDDDDDEAAAGSLSGAGMTTEAPDALALGVPVGAALELAGARDGVVANGRSLRDGADDVEDSEAAGVAAGRADLSSLMPLVSTLSIADVARVSRLPAIVRPIELRKKRKARIPVIRVSRLPAPRADMMPAGPPPMPSAPPSERWIRINPPMLTQMMI